MKLSWIIANVFVCIIFNSLSVQGNEGTRAFRVLCEEFQKRCQGGSNTDCDNCVRVCGAIRNNALADDCRRRFQRDYSNWCPIGALFGTFSTRMLSVQDENFNMGPKISNKNQLRRGKNLENAALKSSVARNAIRKEDKYVNAEQVLSTEDEISLPITGRWRPYECSRGTTSCTRCCEHEYYWCLYGTNDWDCCTHCMAASMTCSSVTGHVSGSGIHGSFGNTGTNLARSAWSRVQNERFCKNVVSSLTR